jgi:hypothetical protein
LPINIVLFCGEIAPPQLAEMAGQTLPGGKGVIREQYPASGIYVSEHFRIADKLPVIADAGKGCFACIVLIIIVL